jgi:hypothetical protein
MMITTIIYSRVNAQLLDQPGNQNSPQRISITQLDQLVQLLPLSPPLLHLHLRSIFLFPLFLHFAYLIFVGLILILGNGIPRNTADSR